MFVVMTVGATEVEILNVKSQILAEGMNPFEHAGSDHVVIAVVGEIGSRKCCSIAWRPSRGSSG
jgi:hypothetical protein